MKVVTGQSTANSSLAVYLASSTPLLILVMSQTAALPSDVPLELSQIRVEATCCITVRSRAWLVHP